MSHVYSNIQIPEIIDKVGVSKNLSTQKGSHVYNKTNPKNSSTRMLLKIFRPKKGRMFILIIKSQKLQHQDVIKNLSTQKGSYVYSKIKILVIPDPERVE